MRLDRDVRKILVYAGIATAGMLAFKAWEAHLRADGALRERTRVLEARNADLAKQAGRIDTLYRHDTLRLTVTRRVTDSILQTDTLFSRDTVTQIVERERNACDAVVRTCEAKQANLLARLAVSDSLRHIAEQRRPGWLKRTFGCTAGVAATLKGAGLGASCGVKIF